MNRLIGKILVLVFFLLPALLLSTRYSAHAAGSGRISGQMLDGSNGNAALADQSVTLQVAQGDSAQDKATTKTDAQGQFSFENLDTDKTLGYVLYTRYQGAQYVSNSISLESNAVQQVNLTVYEATQSKDKLAVFSTTVLFQEPNIQAKTINVSEVFSFSNLDKRAYVGSLDGSKGKPNALLFSLPVGAKNVRLDKGFDGYQVIKVDRGFASDAAVPPGNSDFAFSFDIPYTTSSYDLSYTTQYPTVLLSFLVPPDIHASSTTLRTQGLVNSGKDGHPYNLWRAGTLPAQKEVQLHLEGLFAQEASNAPRSIDPSVPWLVALLVLVVALAVLYWLYRRSYIRRAVQPQREHIVQRQRLQTEQTQQAVQVEERTEHKEAQPIEEEKDVEGAEGPVLTPTQQRHALLRELLELDEAYEAGTLSKESYEERRHKTKTRLRKVLSEQEMSSR